MFPLRDLNPTRTRPWLTWLLILICLGVFVYEALLPGPDQEAFAMSWAFVPAQLTAGDPHALVTIFTSMFLHAGIVHVAGNLWFLHLFGDNVEDAIGRLRYLLLYLIGGVVACLAQYVAAPDAAIPMLGASGAIAAVLGCYAVLYPRARVQTIVPAFVIAVVEVPALLFLFLWLALQIMGSLLAHQGGGVAYVAHVGGFVTGALAGLVFRHRHRGVRQDRPIAREEIEREPWWGGRWSES